MSVSEIFMSVLSIAVFIGAVCVMVKPVKKVSGLSGIGGNVMSVIISVCLTGVVIFFVRHEIYSWLFSHRVAAAAIFIGILYAEIKIFKISHKNYEDVKLTLDIIDEMDGTEFENACVEILLANGFKEIELTKASGDFGVDILAKRGELFYGIQCKRYKYTLDGKPVREVTAGLAYYGCDVGAVMTNSYLTDPALELAEANDIEIWDRDELEIMLKKLK